MCHEKPLSQPPCGAPRQGVIPLGRWAILLLLLVTASRAWALAPDDIALVVNARVPESRKLAEFYAGQRHIPDGRIIEIDLNPGSTINPAEEMPFAAYEAHAAQPIRDFLIRNGLRDKVKCLVTFWGMPLRIGRRQLTAAEQGEAGEINKELQGIQAVAAQQVEVVEKSARQLDPAFTPAPGNEVGQLAARLNKAMTAVVRALPGVQDPAERNARLLQSISVVEKLAGSPRTTELMAEPGLLRIVPRPPTRQEVAAARDRLLDVNRQISEAEGYSPDAQQRLKVRNLARDSVGLLGYGLVLSSQAQTFITKETEAALDSELALLWWKGYPHARWLPNPLQWRGMLQRPRAPFPTLMVMRLDGPSEQSVRNLISGSIEVESQGLTGQIVLDSRGRPASDPYGKYDQTLRNLHDLLSEKTTLKITFDDKESLIPAHSIKDPIAIYCGWYSLRNYYPPGNFARGAVGFHVASFELITLRGRGERGWVRGLLSDGICGTLGPVAEPYLQSFPPADEFFPLLMTGKLTLAEVYWRTTPMASWMQTCIGDPLYNPYKRNPPLKVEDLPATLRGLL